MNLQLKTCRIVSPGLEGGVPAGPRGARVGSARVHAGPRGGPSRARGGGPAGFAGFAVVEGASKEPVGVAFKPVRNVELSVILRLLPLVVLVI